MTETKLSIGAVSAATGIPVSTLRTWERRYGWPEPDRTTGKQRLYDPEVVERLRLVSRALASGHRPAQVLSLGVPELERLVGPEPPVIDRAPAPAGAAPSDWMDAVLALDSDELQRGLRHSAGSLGLVRFLEERVAPFLVRVGEGWHNGDLQTYHEHFASEQVRDFLAGGWRPLAERATGPVGVCATLPGEAHALGLHMAAAVLALCGCRVVFFGPDTPLVDLREGVLQANARALFLSVASGAGPASARAALIELRRLVPPHVSMVIGGGGAPHDVAGVWTATRLSQIPAIVDGLD